MLALDPHVTDMAWKVVEALIPERPMTRHPLGTHRQRVPDKDCFVGLLQRLVTGCSWDVARRLCGIGETTLRTRRTEWLEAGVFDEMVTDGILPVGNVSGFSTKEIWTTLKGEYGSKGKCGNDARHAEQIGRDGLFVYQVSIIDRSTCPDSDLNVPDAMADFNASKIIKSVVATDGALKGNRFDIYQQPGGLGLFMAGESDELFVYVNGDLDAAQLAELVDSFQL